jgi:hypothetical protein
MGFFGRIIGGGEQAQQMQMFHEQQTHDKEITRMNAAFTPGQNEDQILEAIQGQRSDFLKWTQDLEPEVQDLIMQLTNRIVNDEGMFVKRDDQRPLINDEGMKRLLPLVKTGMSKNQMNSNYSEKEINKTLRLTMNDIANCLAENYEEFEVKFVDLSIITRLIKNSIKPTFYRSLNDGQRRHDRSVVKRVEAYSENPQQQKKGFFGT